MDPSLYSSFLPSFASPQPMQYAPTSLNSGNLSQFAPMPNLQPHQGGMFGNMSPAMMFGLTGLLSQSKTGIAPMFGLAGLGLHALKVF